MADLCRREPNPATDSLVPFLLNEAGEEKGICPDFLREAVSRFDEDETVKPMLTKAVGGLSLQLSNMTMNSDYKPYINVSSNGVELESGRISGDKADIWIPNDLFLFRYSVIRDQEKLETAMKNIRTNVMQAMKQIAQFPPLLVAIAEDPLFQMATSAPGIEKHTILGPYFRISPLQAEVAAEYFSSPKTME